MIKILRMNKKLLMIKILRMNKKLLMIKILRMNKKLFLIYYLYILLIYKNTYFLIFLELPCPSQSDLTFLFC
jgi:hypothetical protein